MNTGQALKALSDTLQECAKKEGKTKNMLLGLQTSKVCLAVLDPR